MQAAEYQAKQAVGASDPWGAGPAAAQNGVAAAHDSSKDEQKQPAAAALEAPVVSPFASAPEDVQEKEYEGASMPANEDARLACLCNLDILDTAPDPRFEDITNLVELRSWTEFCFTVACDWQEVPVPDICALSANAGRCASGVDDL